MRAAIYIRVSTDRQAEEGFSIDAQKRKLFSYCESHEWVVVGAYIDEGESAKDTNRTAFQRMLKDAEDGLMDIIVVCSLDRFTRSVRDSFDVIEKLVKWNVSFQSLTQKFETTTAMGRAAIGMQSMFAQLERELIGERTNNLNFL